MERCIFCGSTRKSNPNFRFFGIPKEPGLKRIQWLYVLGDREINQKDRVCAIHFRQGKPSNDPSHEDFIPHLHLKRGSTPENTIEYLESLDSIKDDKSKTNGKRAKPSILGRRKAEKAYEDQVNPLMDTDEFNKQRIATVEIQKETQLTRQSKLIPIPASLTDVIEFKHGQNVLIKHYKLASRKNVPEKSSITITNKFPNT